MPAKIIGELTWFMQPNYPVLSGEEGDEQLVVKYYAGNDLMPKVLPDFGTTFDDYRWPFFNAFDHLTLSDRRIMAMSGEYTYDVELVYTVPEEELEIEYRAIEMSVPIEQHPNYKFCWNHMLIQNASHPEETFDKSTWEGAHYVELTMPKAEFFRILRHDEAIPEGWISCYKPLKPAVEVYQTSVPEITVTRRSIHKDDLTDIANQDNTQQVPPEVFGYENMEWLQSGSDLVKEGRFWVLRTVYTGSKEIDDDIYD